MFLSFSSQTRQSINFYYLRHPAWNTLYDTPNQVLLLILHQFSFKVFFIFSAVFLAGVMYLIFILLTLNHGGPEIQFSLNMWMIYISYSHCTRTLSMNSLSSWILLFSCSLKTSYGLVLPCCLRWLCVPYVHSFYCLYLKTKTVKQPTLTYTKQKKVLTEFYSFVTVS